MYTILDLLFMFGFPILIVLSANIIDNKVDKLYPLPTEPDQYLIEAQKEVDSWGYPGPKLYVEDIKYLEAVEEVLPAKSNELEFFNNIEEAEDYYKELSNNIPDEDEYSLGLYEVNLIKSSSRGTF